ncbi:MAG: hypothetical protein V7609_2117 [Verrucomicrobiota bacterium]
MSTLRAGDVLEVRLLRKIGGKFQAERVHLEADDVRWMSTPELLRTFSGAIATAGERLDITEEHATGADDGSAPWCEACQSYHTKPRDKAHHEALKCFAPWKEPEVAKR